MRFVKSMGLITAPLLCLAACAISPPAHELLDLRVGAAETVEANAVKLKNVPAEAFASASYTAGNGLTIPYRLLSAPVPAQGKLPLVLMLHDSGAIGADNQMQLRGLMRSWAHPDMRARFPAYILVPQTQARSADYQPSPADGELFSFSLPPLAAVMELVERIAAQHAIDADRIYVVGFSMGGSAAWQALLLRPDVFAAAVPIAAIAPDRSLAAVLAGKPLLIVHGNADSENPIASDRLMFARLQAQPGSQVHFREYEGLNHMVPPDMIFATDWREWLFAQKRGHP